MSELIVSHSVTETQALGRRLGELALAGTVLALSGELGAGKTALTQGVASGLGVSQRVTSPTFTLVNRYPTARGFEFVHVDCYRLGEEAVEATAEAMSMGLDEILAAEEAVVVIEWAELVRMLVPPDHLAIQLEPLPDDEAGRRIILKANGPQSSALLAGLCASA